MLTYVLKSKFSNIQVENPVAVLDQEEAKKFLTGKAEDKYAFFMKATELERVDRTYAETVDKVASLVAMNNNSRKLLEGVHARVEELRRKWKEHQQIDELETKLQRLNTEFGWAIYNECDEKYNEAVAVSTIAVKSVLVSLLRLNLRTFFVYGPIFRTTRDWRNSLRKPRNAWKTSRRPKLL